MPMRSAILEQLVRERYGRLLAFSRLLLIERADAEDAVHEALIATFSRPRSFESLDGCEAYVRRAISSRAMDEHRRNARARATLTRVRNEIDNLVPSHEGSLAAASELAQAMALLTPRERACVALRFVERLSVAETAAELSLAQGTVKRYVSDGIAKLNKFLGTRWTDDDLAVVADRRKAR